MLDKASKGTLDDLPKFSASVSAKYIPIVAQFDAGYEFPSVSGIYIEPADKGVIIVATNGHSLCAFHDAEGKATGPVRVHLPPRIVDACRMPDIRRPFDVNGSEWQPKVPGWMVPGKLYLTGLGCFVMTEGDPDTDPEWDENDGCSLARAMIETGNILRDDDYRFIGSPYPDWRKALNKKRAQPAQFVGFNSSFLARFSAVATLCDGSALLTYSLGGVDDPTIIRCDAVPEFVGVIMPIRDPFEAGIPDWAALPQTTSAAA